MCESKSGSSIGCRVDVAGERLGPVGEALVDPVDLVGVLVVLQQVLVLVGERALVLVRPRGELGTGRWTARSAGSPPVRWIQSNASIVMTLRFEESLKSDEKKPAMYVTLLFALSVS